MAALAEITFDTISDGETVTTANTDFDNIYGAGTATGEVATSASGAACGRFNDGGDIIGATVDYASDLSVVYRRCYVRIPTRDDEDRFILDRNYSGGHAGDVRLYPDGTVQLRDVFTGVGTSLTAIPLDSWARLEWTADSAANSQSLALFVGSNRHGSTPDETLSGACTHPTNRHTVGLVTQGAGTYEILFDEIADDDAAMPPPAGSTTVTTGIYRETATGLAVVQFYRETSTGLAK